MLHVMVMVAAYLTAEPPKPIPPSPEQQVESADAAFWAAFNACDRTGMAVALASDVEFYHDRTGATISRDAVLRSLMDGPCGTPGLRVRREVVAGSLSYDPIPGYGAILTGRHRFYARRDGQAERLDGEARFAIVWQSARGRFLMRRILSYAHGPAGDQPIAQPVDVPPTLLQRYVGVYASSKGDVAVALNAGHLHVTSGGLSTDLIPLGATVFRAHGRPLRFEFIEAGGQVDRILVQENGVTVAEGARKAR